MSTFTRTTAAYVAARPLAVVEAELRAARRDVFDADPAVVDAASAAITRLRAELTAHPEERARRDRVDAAASESLLRRWA